MSDDFLRFLPRDPRFVPSTGLWAAITMLRRFAPNADIVEAHLSDTVQFVDPGGNLEQVRCPECRTEITDWWPDAMNAAYVSKFEDLSVTLPCCGITTSLNDLEYDWAAGFARFVLEARNASIGGALPSDQVAELETLLGCELKQVLAHY